MYVQGISHALVSYTEERSVVFGAINMAVCMSELSQHEYRGRVYTKIPYYKLWEN